MIRVADYVTQALRDHGVDTVFLLSGGGMMYLVDAAGKTEGVRYICSHHEQASAMAADGYARQRGGLGACYATSGPGGTNLITGIVSCWQDSTPVVFVTGQSKTSQTIARSGIPGLRQFGTFEVDIVPIVQSITKYAHMLDDVTTVRYHVEKAIFRALGGRPGPVLLDIPIDVQGMHFDPVAQPGFLAEPDSMQASEADIRLLVQLLRKAARPVILAGYGIRVANAQGQLERLAATKGIPVVVTQLGKDTLQYDHECFVGHSGPKGDRAGNFALQAADLIISIGCSLHAQTTGWEPRLFAPKATIVLVDPDQAVHKRQEVHVQHHIIAGAKQILEALLDVDLQRASVSWSRRCHDWKSRFAVKNEPHKRDARINFYDFAEMLSDTLTGTETIVTDAGSAFYVMGQAFRLKKGQRFICSGSLGAMGFAVPAACGAALASPQRDIVCVTGDGSLMTNIHDLATISHHNLAVKLFVINNQGYVSIRNTQRAHFGGRQVGTDIESGVFIPKMVDVATTFDIPHLLCDRPEALKEFMVRAMAMRGPVLCEIAATTEQEIIPTVASVRRADGRMESQPIHNMTPLIPVGELAQIMDREDRR